MQNERRLTDQATSGKVTTLLAPTVFHYAMTYDVAGVCSSEQLIYYVYIHICIFSSKRIRYRLDLIMSRFTNPSIPI